MKYIKRFHNAHALSVSVGNSYSEDQLMHIFQGKFQQSGKYSAQTASHQAELRREENFTDQKSLKISSLQTDYINLDSRLRFGRHIEIASAFHTRCIFCGGTNHSAEKCFKKIRNEKGKNSCG